MPRIRNMARTRSVARAVPLSVGIQNLSSLDLERGSSQYAEILDAAQTGLDITGDCTIEGWFKFESIPSIDGDIWPLATKWGGAGSRQYQFTSQHNGVAPRLRAGISGDGSAGDIRDFVFTPSAGAWVHLAVTWDISEPVATQFTFVVNGVSQGNGVAVLDAGVTVIGDTTAPYRHGSIASSGTQFFDGLINTIRIWNVIRTPTEILDNMSKFLGHLAPAGLISEWRDGITDVVNGNTMTAVGSPATSTDVPFPVG